MLRDLNSRLRVINSEVAGLRSDKTSDDMMLGVRGLIETAEKKKADLDSEARRLLFDRKVSDVESEMLLEAARAVRIGAEKVANEKQQLETDTLLSMVEQVINRLTERVQAEGITSEYDDYLLESDDEVCEGCRKEQLDEMDDEEDDGPSSENLGAVQLQASLDSFLDSIILDTIQEFDADEESVMHILDMALESLIGDEQLGDLPDFDADPEEVALWIVNAIRLDLPGLVMKLASGVESEES